MKLVKAANNLYGSNGEDYREFPLPNDHIMEYYARPRNVIRTVVASVTYVDDDRGEIALVLLLNEAKPFFTVAHYYITDMAAEGDAPFYPKGTLFVLGNHENIVPAVEDYTQSGGDY